MMKLRQFTALACLACASPALADKLVFDHRLNPALTQALDSGRRDLILFNDKNPAYVTDLIVVRGQSVKDWTEAMVIIARKPGEKVPGPAEWLTELKGQAAQQCQSEFAVLAEDENSLTLERRSSGCPANYPANAIYRIVKGKPSLFLLGAMSKDGFTADARKAWLALFASAHLE